MEFSIWENLLLGVIALGVIFWMKPGIRASLKMGKNAESDWMGFLVPMGFVIMFVVFLIAMV